MLCEQMPHIHTIHRIIQTAVRSDLQLTINMSVLAIKQLFEDADSQEVELQMDTSKIEDASE
jgi:hypothetical protein